MADIAKTTYKGLGLPKHYDPSVAELMKNMEIVDDILQKAVPNDLTSITDANAQSSINALTTTGRYLVKSNATGYPVSGQAGIVDVYKAGSYILQEWRSINSPNYEYRRYSTNSGSSWNSWFKMWNANNDGSGSGLDADLLDGINSSGFLRIQSNVSNFNSATAEGKYRVTSGTNAPYTGCTDWIVLVFHAGSTTNELYQIAMEECYYSNTSITGGTTTSYSYNVPMIFVRKRYSGTWYSWQLLWNSGNDGAGSGMDADKLDGNHASAFALASHAKSDGSNGKATDSNYGHVLLSSGITSGISGAIADGVAFGYKHITGANIDNLYTTGFYVLDTSATCANGLPFSGVTSPIGYGLLVLRTQLTAGNNCCTQIIFVDGGGSTSIVAQDVYYRVFHENKWSPWRPLSPVASDILTKLKTVDGESSGLDADLLDGYHANALPYYTKITHLTTVTDIDTLTTEGFYEGDDANFTSSKGALPTFNTAVGSLSTDYSGYGLLMKSTKGQSNYDCGVQFLFRDNSTEVYVRSFHGNAWSSWSLLGSTTEANTLKGVELIVKGGTSANPLNIYDYTAPCIFVEGYVALCDPSGTSLKTIDTTDTPVILLYRNEYEGVIMYGGKDGGENSIVHYATTSGLLLLTLPFGASRILAKLKTMDGSGSGLDADTLDGVDSTGFSKTSYVTSLPTASGVYTWYSSEITGASAYYGLTVAYNSSTYGYSYTAVSFATGKVYVKTSSQTAWGEITPKIPVVTEDPVSPSEGQMWILSE